MKTLVFKISPSESDKEIIKSWQNDYSQSFRKLYNNIEQIQDKEFLNTLKIKSKRQIEYLQIEVESFYKRNKANKLRIQNNINKLESYTKLSLKQFKHLQYLKKSLEKEVVFGNKSELIKLSKGIGDKEKWQESRLLPLIFYGEANRYGNRFFILKELSKGNILFKMESSKIKIPITINTKKHKETLILLNQFLLRKEIPITIKLTTDKIYISYDESKLAGTYLDIKKFYKTINHIKDKSERTKLIHNKYIEHENGLKEGKLDRYLAIDLNPDGIGYSIIDNTQNSNNNKNFNKNTFNFTIIDKGFIDISKNLKANKRKYETSIMLKTLFTLIKHYRCHTIVLEELDLNNNLGNKVSNRKIKNLWNRTIINEIIQRRCNEQGILKIEINPCYTSFIGNIMNNTYDPIASSIEIGRRGITKYSKGGFYPEIDITNYINDERYDAIKGCSSWKDMFSLFITSKWNYRRKLNEFNFTEYYIGNSKSAMKHLHFG